MVQAAADADILIFVVPHQFIRKICDQLKGHLKANTIGMSLIKVPGTPSCGWGRVRLTVVGFRVGEARTEMADGGQEFAGEERKLTLERLRKAVRCWGSLEGRLKGGDKRLVWRSCLSGSLGGVKECLGNMRSRLV